MPDPGSYHRQRVGPDGVVIVGGGGIARPFSTQFISVTEILSKSLLGFKKVTVEASEITVGYMTV